MRTGLTRLSIAVIVTLVVGIAPAADPAGNSSTVVRKLFSNPPREYSTAPLWVWNDRMTDEEVVSTLRDLAAQQVRQAFVHPRPGLMTPYLSDEWFRAWKTALWEAARLDMNLWIYDENSYPSGFAGGFVPDAMPESRGRGLELRENKSAPAWSDAVLAVYRLEGEKVSDVSADVKAGRPQPEGRYVVASMLRSRPAAWHGGKTYVDLLYPGVTEKFLSITMDAYRREIGGEFGRRVPGVFTDEPEIRPAGGLPWTEDLPQQFEKRWGYRLMEHLPSLALEIGDWKKVRHNYLQLLSELFIERWAKPYYEYCERNRLEFTGHYWEHDWPNGTGVPDNMAMAAWQQRPGIDTLMNQYREDTHAQFGNVRAVKEVASLANQLGRRRTLSEGYGAGGWDLRFEDMKRIGDWMYVLGINTLDEHLSYVTIRGARKRDHPQSFSYHEPWWEAYKVNAAYFARLSAALSSGEQVNDVLVLEPTTSAWLYNGPGRETPALKDFGDRFQDLVTTLEKEQLEFDLGCEDVLARHGAASGAGLRVGRRTYTTVVLPPRCENLNLKTVELLQRYLDNGGRLYSCSDAPVRVDGAQSTVGARLASSAGWMRVEAKGVPALLRERAGAGTRVVRSAGDKGILYHHRRRLEDGELLFLVNTNLEAPSSGEVLSQAGGAEEWDAETGQVAACRFEARSDGIRIPFNLAPGGSRLLFLAKDRRMPAEAPAAMPAFTDVALNGTVEVRRLHPNVLVLDYADVSAGGEELKDAYIYQASQFAFRRNGLERNPWDSAVQFRDELISRTFPPGSGFRATYRFTIRDRVPGDLKLCVERPDLYTISVNGTRVTATPGSWWLDRSFGLLDIRPASRTGENTVVLEASPMTMLHELESVYVLGDFALEPGTRGFTIVPAAPLKAGSWKQQGLPLYGHTVAYSGSFRKLESTAACKVVLGKWYGSVAKVAVNGEIAGYISHQPWEIDVTRLVRQGDNRVEVVVFGTLKNTLGPHHGDPQLGTAWPAMFQKAPVPCPAPGNSYSTVDYGLFEPFRIQASK